MDARTVKRYVSRLQLESHWEKRSLPSIEPTELPIAKQSPIPIEQRECWISLQQQYPQSTKTELRKLAPATYAWLYRLDLRTDRKIETNRSGIIVLFLGCQVNADLWVPVKKLIWNESGYRMGCVAGVERAIASSRLWQNYFGLLPVNRISITATIPPVYASRMPLARPQ